MVERGGKEHERGGGVPSLFHAVGETRKIPDTLLPPQTLSDDGSHFVTSPGEIHVSLVLNQFRNWSVAKKARQCGLYLAAVRPWIGEHFPLYNCRFGDDREAMLPSSSGDGDDHVWSHGTGLISTQSFYINIFHPHVMHPCTRSPCTGTPGQGYVVTKGRRRTKCDLSQTKVGMCSWRGHPVASQDHVDPSFIGDRKNRELSLKTTPTTHESGAAQSSAPLHPSGAQDAPSPLLHPSGAQDAPSPLLQCQSGVVAPVQAPVQSEGMVEDCGASSSSSNKPPGVVSTILPGAHGITPAGPAGSSSSNKPPGVVTTGTIGKGRVKRVRRKSHTYSKLHTYGIRIVDHTRLDTTHFIFKDACKNTNFGL